MRENLHEVQLANNLHLLSCNEKQKRKKKCENSFDRECEIVFSLKLFLFKQKEFRILVSIERAKRGGKFNLYTILDYRGKVVRLQTERRDIQFLTALFITKVEVKFDLCYFGRCLVSRHLSSRANDIDLGSFRAWRNNRYFYLLYLLHLLFFYLLYIIIIGIICSV